MGSLLPGREQAPPTPAATTAELDEEFAFLRAENVERIPLAMVTPDDPVRRDRRSAPALRRPTPSEKPSPAAEPVELTEARDAVERALLAFYPDPGSVGSQCAELTTRVLAGEVSPAEIGIRSPDQFRVAVNRRIERLLEMSVSPDLRADD